MMMNIKNKIAKAMVMSPLLAMLSDVHGHANMPLTIDVSGAKQVTTETVAKKCKNEIQEIAAKKALMSDIDLSSTKGQGVITAINQLKTCIMRGEKEFAVNIETVLYPSDNSMHLSVNLIEKNKMKIAFNRTPTQTLPDPVQLIEKWQAYEYKVYKKVLQNKKSPIMKNCPVLHCYLSYGDPEFKTDETYFINEVPKHISELTKILREDKDANKRASAAYLLAHMHDGNELIKILTPSIRDPDQYVRNNILRVISQAINKCKPENFPIADVVDALNFPTITDANKSLLVIASIITQQPKYYSYVILHASNNLLHNLRQQQPNVHELSYYILKTISGKNYGEHDYIAWENWVKTQNLHV